MGGAHTPDPLRRGLNSISSTQFHLRRRFGEALEKINWHRDPELGSLRRPRVSRQQLPCCLHVGDLPSLFPLRILAGKLVLQLARKFPNGEKLRKSAGRLPFMCTRGPNQIEVLGGYDAPPLARITSGEACRKQHSGGVGRQSWGSQWISHGVNKRNSPTREAPGE